ncbi:MAG: 4-alpha-glucanotransferase [Lachnospiraceae bacterium]|nr:4-alpha-glucanotransferase [Lachnospiraceae bacterium]
MRASGILLPVSSLPSRYGIGGFTKEAYDWIDFLKKSGQTFWQILPLGHTSYGDSPYQPFSTVAGNPYFVSLDDLIEQGLLTREECDAAALGTNPSYVDYGKQFENRYPLLRKAYANDKKNDQTAFEDFLEKEADWLPDYALFMAVKDLHEEKAWYDWEEPYKKRDPETLEAARKALADDISFHEHVQYWFMTQWVKLKAYAQEQGIRIIGDLPIYVAIDSADAWVQPELFQFDEDLNPTSVAGVPPDAFSEDGQLWGNPLYDWDYHKKTGYAWWIDRVRHAAVRYDVMRFDHFRGFDEYFAVPYGAETARKGRWMPGPGMDLMRAIQENVDGIEIIAEDLGVVTESVEELLEESEFPGMKVLQFAFGDDSENAFLPHNYKNANCVVYTGTHDNETLFQFLCNTSDQTREHIKNYLNRYWDTYEQLCDNLIRLAMTSIAKYCIIPMQDYLHLGGEARINFPSTLGGNWEWRLTPEQLDGGLSDFIKNITEVSGRSPKESEDPEESEDPKKTEESEEPEKMK